MTISHEAIYQCIYVNGAGGLRRELKTCLRTGRALRRPRGTTGRPGPVPNLVSITQRPEEAWGRAVPGYWEGDLIMGKDNKSAVGTLVDRCSRYVMLLHLPDGHSAEQVRDEMVNAVARMPAALRKSVTWDQGFEMRLHERITELTGLDIYFADPGSPWQRGSNENTNGLLRQYFPKSTDLSFWGPGYLEQVAIEMNNRPRKRLGWRTPAEALDQLLSEHDKPGAALTG